MANYSLIGLNNKVIQTIYLPDTYDTEETANAYLNSVGLSGLWLKTSYNTLGGIHYTCTPILSGNYVMSYARLQDSGRPYRLNYGQIGCTYDPTLDAFITPKPNYTTWVLNSATGRWIAPVPYPTDGKVYSWNDNTVSWTA